MEQQVVYYVSKWPGKKKVDTISDQPLKTMPTPDPKYNNPSDCWMYVGLTTADFE